MGEKVVRDLIKSRVKCTESNTEICLSVFYKSKKTSLLVKQNNLPILPSSSAKRFHVV